MSKLLSEGEFDPKIQEKSTEVEALALKVKQLGREKDMMAADSEERILLSLKKEELESHKKKHKKMQVKNLCSFYII